MKLVKCLIYLALVGIIGFVAGRFIPKKWFLYKKAPWKSFEFEENGKIYERIRIKEWQNKLPDMSKILPKMMLPKKVPEKLTVSKLEGMIAETCIAELIHIGLAIFGFGCLFIWEGFGGILISLLYLLGNLPFVFIQRYNRPRFVSLLNKTEEKYKCI